MNFALSAIILILLLMPGTVLIKAYYSSFTDKASRPHIPFNDLLVSGLIWTIILHCTFLCVINLYRSIEFKFLYQIISGVEISERNGLIETYVKQFITYIIVSVIIGFLLGKGFKLLVKSRNLDLQYYGLHSTSYWFQMFSARRLDEPGVRGTIFDVDFIYVDILTKEHFLYSGRLLDFNYSPYKDELENIVLANSEKRRVKSENSAPDDCEMTSIKTIPGHALVILASNILNINIFYINLSESENSVEKGEIEMSLV